MTLFSRFTKPTFWTQFFFGIVAVLALPEVSHSESHNTDNVAEQQVLNVVPTIKQADSEQIFLQQARTSVQQPIKQAVEICIFSARYYRLECHPNPPIRAGPVA
ncbi:secA translation cis-regulator SecM [Bibersteinia trehalosi]|uniref:secA translation cis-regulator SecM n=1 Tax=Bibersteinia trehalosi TaxID=47735 RepID=UPI002D785CAF|nr:secA translation cis-regulator SecM [Bibersteinia trehalosi]